MSLAAGNRNTTLNISPLTPSFASIPGQPLPSFTLNDGNNVNLNDSANIVRKNPRAIEISDVESTNNNSSPRPVPSSLTRSMRNPLQAPMPPSASGCSDNDAEFELASRRQQQQQEQQPDQKLVQRDVSESGGLDKTFTLHDKNYYNYKALHSPSSFFGKNNNRNSDISGLEPRDELEREAVAASGGAAILAEHSDAVSVDNDDAPPQQEKTFFSCCC